MAALARAIENRPSSLASFLDDINGAANISRYGTHARNRLDMGEILRLFFLAFEPMR